MTSNNSYGWFDEVNWRKKLGETELKQNNIQWSVFCEKEPKFNTKMTFNMNIEKAEIMSIGG